MRHFTRRKTIVLAIFLAVFFNGCSGPVENVAESGEAKASETRPPALARQNANANFPNLQAEILSNQNSLTTSPIGQIDFRNSSFPFPRGWQDVDSKEFTLQDGKRPISSERVGMSYVTTKYGDVTGDGLDEAFVIIKIETGGGSVPQIVYVYTLKDEKPELIWHFRSGDRADGGLKRIYAENGNAVVELYGQDRYVLGEVETMRIDGDEEQLCCPTFFTSSTYKWNGSNFSLSGKRHTFSLKDENAAAVENMGEGNNKQKNGKK